MKFLRIDPLNNTICNIIFDSKQKSSVFVDKKLHQAINSQCNRTVEILNDIFLSIPMTILVNEDTHFYTLIDDVIKWTIPAGIPQFWAEYHDWYNFYRNHNYFIEDTGPKIFTFENLSFGFTIWLGACVISTIGFLTEMFIMIANKLRKMSR
jgi:hypothetical protein